MCNSNRHIRLVLSLYHTKWHWEIAKHRDLPPNGCARVQLATVFPAFSSFSNHIAFLLDGPVQGRLKPLVHVSFSHLLPLVNINYIVELNTYGVLSDISFRMGVGIYFLRNTITQARH